MILVVGGTGTLGSAITRRLLAQERPVRVMTRTPQKAKELQEAGAEIFQGDLRDRASLARACQGAQMVLAAAHSIMGNGSEASRYVDGQGHKWLIDEAKKAGVERFIYISIMGAAPESGIQFFDTKFDVEQYLHRSGLEYVILRPSAFMETHAYMMIGQPILESGKVMLFGKGENPRNFVAADDVARFVLTAFDDPRTTSQVIPVGGPENLTNIQVVALYEEIAGHKAQVSHIPLPMMRVMAPLLRPFKPGLSQVMQVSLHDDTADCTFDMSEVLDQYPMKLTRLEEWAREHLPGEVGRMAVTTA
jgi:NADH dehydrogenase